MRTSIVPYLVDGKYYVIPLDYTWYKILNPFTFDVAVVNRRLQITSQTIHK